MTNYETLPSMQRSQIADHKDREEEPGNNHEHKLTHSKATSSLFPIKIIAKLEWT